MNDRLDNFKKAVKHHAPVIVTTSVAVIVSIAYYKKSTQWHAYILTQEQRDLMAASSDACVAFEKQKVMILGRPWNPEI